MTRSRSTEAIDTVLFDFGNTLVDYHTGGLTDDEKDLLGVRNMASALERWRVPVTFSELHDRFYLHWRERLRHRKRMRREIDVRPSMLRAIPEAFLTPARMRRLLLTFHEPTIRFAELHEGAADLLRTLHRRGATLVLVANTPIPGYCHDAALRALGVGDLFAHRQYSYDIGIRKPDPEFFRRAMNAVGAVTEHTALVGDSWRLEIEPAAAMGLRTFWYQPKGGERKGGRRVKRVRKLGEVLEGLG